MSFSDRDDLNTVSTESIVQQLDSLTGVDLSGGDYAVIARVVNALSQEEQSRLLHLVVGALSDKQLCADGAVRINATRALVALLPQSFEVIESFLTEMNDHCSYERHFTLFCYLDWVPELSWTASLSPDVLRCVHKYLINVRSTKALSAWMAAHMLGAHWEPAESAPILLDSLSNARYVAGREASASGLLALLRGTTGASKISRKVRSALRLSAKTDASLRVRSAAYIARRRGEEALK
jgi:hypothetical protein